MIAHVFNAASGRDMGWVVTVPNEGFSVGQVIWNNGRRYEIAKIVRDHLFVWKPVLSAGKRKVEGTLREMVETSKAQEIVVEEFDVVAARHEHDALRDVLYEEHRIMFGDPGDER